MLGLCAASLATVWLQCSLGSARGARADLPLPPFGRLTQTWRKRGANPLALGPEHKPLGELERIAARTATDFVRATLNEPELAAAHPRPGHRRRLPARRQLRAAAGARDGRADGGIPAARTVLHRAAGGPHPRQGPGATAHPRLLRQPRARRATQGSPGARGCASRRRDLRLSLIHI